MFSIYKKKVKKLLNYYNDSMRKVCNLLRIKNGNLILKNLDYILKDKLNISDTTPFSYRHQKSRSQSHNRSIRSDEINDEPPQRIEKEERDPQSPHFLPKVC